MKGIDSNKHQPIVRANRDVNVKITSLQTPVVDYMKYFHEVMAREKKLKEKIEPKRLVDKKTQATLSEYESSYPIHKHHR